MSTEQGTLFTDIIETEESSAVDPEHYEGPRRTVTGYDMTPGFEEDADDRSDVAQESDHYDDDILDARRSVDNIDSNELARSAVSGVSDARRLEGLTKAGLDSVRVHQQAERHRSSPREVYNDALRRSGEYYESAEQDYRKWMAIGSAFVSFATQKYVIAPPFTRFYNTYWGSKAADRRRAKLQKRLKK